MKNPFKGLSDHHLSFRLDRLEKTPAVPGSKADKARGRLIGKVKAEIRRRAEESE